MERFDKVIVVISDCHLSAGKLHEGQINPHEDFHFDDDMVEFVEYFSSGKYGEQDGVPVEVELVLAGDYFDFLNVPVRGEFEDAITEEISVEKVKKIMAGHPLVMQAHRQFVAKPGKKLTYLIGNHDADLFFEKVQEEITRAWDPNGEYPSEKVKVVADRDRLSYDEAFEIRHGNQLEAGNELDFEEPFVEGFKKNRLLRLPWGSIYVLKIINRMKWEREFIDKIRPIKVYIIFGLVFDTWFTLKFCFLSGFYFFKTRFTWKPTFRRRKKNQTVVADKKKSLLDTIKDEAKFFQDLEVSARKILDQRDDLQTIVMGHTHRPMNKVFPDGKQYINTGTWTKMIDLDWRGLGQQFRRTFALIHVVDGKAECTLRQWQGESGPHKHFTG